MHPAERLAAYLANEMAPDERAVFERELERDAGLRAQLNAMRRADHALADMPAVETPAGFRARLDEAIEPELRTIIGADVTPIRRRSRDAVSSRWFPQLAAAAAGLVVLVAVVVGVRGGPAVSPAPDVAADAPEMFTAEAEAPSLTELTGVDGPMLVLTERELDADAIEHLIDLPPLHAVAAEEHASETAAVIAELWRDELTYAAASPEALRTDDADAADDADLADGAGDASPDGPATLQEPLTEQSDDPVAADVEIVGQCLAVLLDSEQVPIPVYAKLAVDEDATPVVVYGLISHDPATGAHTRREVWIVERDDCHVRRFAQAP